MRQEFIVFVLFLAVNVALSVNCVFTYITTEGLDGAYKKRKYETSSRIDEEQTNKFSFINNIIAYDSSSFRFSFKNEKDKCLYIQYWIYKYDLTRIRDCYNEDKNPRSYSKWAINKVIDLPTFTEIIQKDVKIFINPAFPNKIILLQKFPNPDLVTVFDIDPSTNEISKPTSIFSDTKEFQMYIQDENGKELESQYNCLLYIDSSSLNFSYIVFFKSIDFKNKVYYLNWDKEIITTSNIQLSEILWMLSIPIGLIADIATLPYQFIVGVTFLFFKHKK